MGNALNGTVTDRMKITHSYPAWKNIYMLSEMSANGGKKKFFLADVNSFCQIVQPNYSLHFKEVQRSKG